MSNQFPRDVYQARYNEITKAIVGIFGRTGWDCLTGDDAWVYQAAIINRVKELMPEKCEWSISRCIRKMAQDGILESGYWSGRKDRQGWFRWGGN